MIGSALRYSIAFILFICLCVAGFLAGYRVGFSNGYASGEAKRESERPYPKVYEVGDIIRTTGDDSVDTGDQLAIEFLMGAVQTTVFPEEWEALGGQCTMSPIPWLESLAVNATSGVHDRLQVFFGDLSALKLAVEKSREEYEAIERARRAKIARMLDPVADDLGKELTPIESNIDLVGTWTVSRMLADELVPAFRYTFVDKDTVKITSLANASSPTETWYFVYSASLGISGTNYLAATTPDGELVLIAYNDPQTFLVAKPSEGEPSDPHGAADRP